MCLFDVLTDVGSCIWVPHSMRRHVIGIEVPAYRPRPVEVEDLHRPICTVLNVGVTRVIVSEVLFRRPAQNRLLPTVRQEPIVERGFALDILHDNHLHREIHLLREGRVAVQQFRCVPGFCEGPVCLLVVPLYELHHDLLSGIDEASQECHALCVLEQPLFVLERATQTGRRLREKAGVRGVGALRTRRAADNVFVPQRQALQRLPEAKELSSRPLSSARVMSGIDAAAAPDVEAVAQVLYDKLVREDGTLDEQPGS